MGDAEQYFSATPSRRPGGAEYIVEHGASRLVLRTTPGTFSASRLDPGTRVLLDVVPPPPPTGALLDIGCANGVLSLVLATLSPEAQVWGVEVNPAALDCARANAAANGVSNVTFCRPEEVPADVRFATLWSNPPVRVGKTVLHGILHTWLPRLEPDAVAWLVVQRHLGADSLAEWLSEQGWRVERAASRRGYRVLRVTASSDPPRSAA